MGKYLHRPNLLIFFANGYNSRFTGNKVERKLMKVGKCLHHITFTVIFLQI